MINSGWLISFSFLYLAILFVVAWWGERSASQGRSLVNNPYVYALSLAVYCTAWTYYGSVGRAAETGIEFLTIYLGPTLTVPLWWRVLRKIIRICRAQQITTLADFVSARYGQSLRLSYLTTLVCVLGVLPYIALQLKAIATSFTILSTSNLAEAHAPGIWQDTTFYIAIVLGIFVILFGSRTLDGTDRHEGMVLAVAFESLVKLLAFLIVGIVIVFGIFGGLEEIYSRAAEQPALQRLFVIEDVDGSSRWFWMLLISTLAFLFLPRQFQVAVLENTREDHLRKAMWLFPLYLLLINIFVMPVGLAGRLTFPLGAVNADTYMLSLPLWAEREGLALLSYLGGISAATSMIIVSTIALSLMISHNVLAPFVLGRERLKTFLGPYFARILVTSRRVNVVVILLMAYAYYRGVSASYSLVSIGLISFAAIVQLAPAILGGLYWKEGSKPGAVAGILGGFVLWGYTLVLPTLADQGSPLALVMQEGLFGLHWLRPHGLFGLTTLSPLAHGVFWSLLVNVSLYVSVSLNTTRSTQERNQAEVFVDIFRYAGAQDAPIGWKGQARVDEIRLLLTNFLGEERANQALHHFAQKHGRHWESDPVADAPLVNYAEKLLASAMGTASARVLMRTTLKEEEVSLEEVYDILREAQQIFSVNQELLKKQSELSRATEALQQANHQLKHLSEQKDDFITTVTHEMRTPLTAIRAMVEIVADTKELQAAERDHFLATIIKEVDRMNRLISQVLDLEKLDSGKMTFSIAHVDIKSVFDEVQTALQSLLKEKAVALSVIVEPQLPALEADRDRLVQVMINLLANSVAAVGTKQGSIALGAQVEEEKMLIWVEDNGKGIASEIQPFIFNKFYQAENQTVRKPKGSGLGLAICQRIVHGHGGRIWFESEPAKGTTFWVQLPLHQTELTEV